MRLYTNELVKKYKSRTVVNHVSIDVRQGEIVGLLGPNGAGKTTTFYMIVGLIKPNEGASFSKTTRDRFRSSPTCRSIGGRSWAWVIWRRRLRFSAG